MTVHGALVMSPSSYAARKEGGTFKTGPTLTSSVYGFYGSFSAWCTQSWLHKSGSLENGLGSKVTITVDPNNTVYERTGKVSVSGRYTSTLNSGTSYNVTIYCTVTQEGHPATATVDEASFGVHGGTANVSVVTQNGVSWNVDSIEYASSQDWITTNVSGGTGSKSVAFSVKPNYLGQQRSANIVVAGVTNMLCQAGHVAFSGSVDAVTSSMTIPYWAEANNPVTLTIDGVSVLTATNCGTYVWQPKALGLHELCYSYNGTAVTNRFRVAKLVFAEQEAPNPPSEEDGSMTIGSESRSFTASGGSYAFATSGTGTWTATTSADWITIASALSSRDVGLPVAYKVLANENAESRVGYVYVNGHVHTVSQAGVGGSLNASSMDFDALGGDGVIEVTVTGQSNWQVKSNSDWMWMDSTSGCGSGTVVYHVVPWNEVSTRSGSITVAGETYIVNQTGRLMRLSSNDESPDYGSHVLDIQVSALSFVEWEITPNNSWISVVDGGGGHGGDNVAVAIAENPSYLSRVGTVQIGSEIVTITQAGRPGAALVFSIDPELAVASVGGANGLVTIYATPDLPWTASSAANWITIAPSRIVGSGNGNVVYSVTPNSTLNDRTGTITISPDKASKLNVKTHTVVQPAATAIVSADKCAIGASGGACEIDVATGETVSWSISKRASWITVGGAMSRVGSGKVVLTISENPTIYTRESVVDIAGLGVSVVQSGRDVDVSYDSRVFGCESDYATIEVHVDGNVSWTAVSSDPTWITLLAGDDCDYDADGNVIGMGDGTIEYLLIDYVGDGAPRTGTITIGDKTVYITQRPYDLSINPSAATVGGNAGAGSVGVPATAGQVWNAIATEPWITVQSGYDAGTGSGTVRYTYTDNDTGEERTGRIIIAGEEYTITQAARQMVAVNVTTRVVTGSGEPTTGNGGVVSGAGTYDRGTSVTLTATANDGYEFLNWTLPNGSTTGGAQLVVTADVNKEIFANFRRIPVYAVNGESDRRCGDDEARLSWHEPLSGEGHVLHACRHRGHLFRVGPLADELSCGGQSVFRRCNQEWFFSRTDSCMVPGRFDHRPHGRAQ